MGRIFYASSKRNEAGHDRLVHILSTPDGTVVLAMRPPEPGERGYSVGVDCTVMSAVAEMFADWTNEEPGWVQEPRKALPPSAEISRGPDQTYDVTILAAFEIGAEARELIAMARENDPDAKRAPDTTCDGCGREDPSVRPADGSRELCVRCEATRALRDIADRDHKTLNRRPEWSDVCEVWEGELDFDHAVVTLGTGECQRVYFAQIDQRIGQVQ